MKDNILLIFKLEKFKTDRDDIGNVDCENCGKQCHRSKEVWYWMEFKTSMISLCTECVSKLRENSSKSQLTRKELSEIIHEALTDWDYNPMSKKFSNELAITIVQLELKKLLS